MKELLPPNSTPLEQRLADALSTTFDLGEQHLRGLKLKSPPSNWLQALIFEYGLGELTPYLPSEKILQEGISFLRIRGTAAAVKMALSWKNITADVIESPPSFESHQELAATTYKPYLHFAEYDLELAVYPTLQQICQIVPLATLGQPIRSRLWRLRYGYNRDVFRLDNSRLDDGLLSDDSGVFIQLRCLSNPQKISFALQSSHAVELGEVTVEQSIYISQCKQIFAWEANTLYLDDFPEIKEVYSTSISSGSEQVAPAYYTEQVWTAASWASAEGWTDTRTIITMQATIKERR